jgi:hypothetical protein
MQKTWLIYSKVASAFFILVSISWLTKISYIGTSSVPKELQNIALVISIVPDNVISVLRSFGSRKTIDPHHYNHIPVEHINDGWNPDYAVVSRSTVENHDIIGLLDLESSKFTPIHTNRLDETGGRIFESKIGSELVEPPNKKYTRAYHPLIIGSTQLVYINGWNSISSIDLNTHNEKWRINGAFHHSIELDDENCIIACASEIWYPTNNSAIMIDHLDARFEDNLIVKMSIEGDIIYTKSIYKMLTSAGLEYLVFGTRGESLRGDPFHINQITPIKNDSKGFKRGQLLISLRNLSAIILFDPKNDMVVWHKTGPWMNQHCAMVYDDDSISVLDNHSYVYQSPKYWVSDDWFSNVKTFRITGNTVDEKLPIM